MNNLDIYIPSRDRSSAPIRVNETDAGIDIRSNIDTVISPNSRKLIGTGIKIQLPNNTYGQVAPRSGLACKGIDVGAGIIDQGYTGEVRVLLINSNPKEFKINKYDKIAQLLVLPIMHDSNMNTNIIYSDIGSNTNSARGASGFGSSGV